MDKKNRNGTKKPAKKKSIPKMLPLPQADDSDSDEFNPFEEIKPEPEPLRTWWLSKVLTPMLTSKFEKEDTRRTLVVKLQEEEERKAMIKEREEMLERLRRRKDELKEENRRIYEMKLSNSSYIKDENVDRILEETERECEEADAKQEVVNNMEQDMVVLEGKRRVLDGELEVLAPYKQLMEQVVSLSHYTRVQPLVDNLESQLHLREQLCQREKEAEEEAFQQRKEAAAKEAENETTKLRKMSQVYELRTQLEDLCSERQAWENKWSNIQKTAAEKTVRMAQAKMATLNLYETIQGEGVDVNDTEEQLDRIQTFIHEHDEVLRRLQDETV